MITIKNCLVCNSPLKGRIDKKFCDDYCRNQFNNQQKSQERYYQQVRLVNNILLKNRKIIGSLLNENNPSIRVHRQKLQELGFNFGYVTQLTQSKTGKTLFHCYDFSYCNCDQDKIYLTRKTDANPNS
ncbi:MAG: hypothetical protein RLY16_2331 [Bacteroidota bacterium]|jgi:predicted nucleic acid-binding Zn ribbon protein